MNLTVFFSLLAILNEIAARTLTSLALVDLNHLSLCWFSLWLLSLALRTTLFKLCVQK